MAKQQQQQFASLMLTDFVQGGLIDDVDVVIQESKFTDEFDFGGSAPGTISLKWVMRDGDGNLHEHYASMGKVTSENFAVSEDGAQLVPTGDRTSLVRGSNGFLLMESAVACGFPNNRLAEQGAPAFEGWKFHILRKQSPKRPGLMNQKENSSHLVVTEATPPEAAGKAGGKAKAGAGGAKSTSTAKAAPAAAAADTDANEPGPYDDALQAVVMQVIADGPVAKTKLVPAVFKLAEGDAKTKAGMTKRVVEEAFLQAGVEAGLWAWNGKEIGPAE